MIQLKSKKVNIIIFYFISEIIMYFSASYGIISQIAIFNKKCNEKQKCKKGSAFSGLTIHD